MKSTKNKFILITLIVGIVLLIIGGSLMPLFRKRIKLEDTVDTISDHKKIKNVEIEVKCAEITIKPGDDFTVAANNVFLDDYSFEVSDDTFSVSYLQSVKGWYNYNDSNIGFFSQYEGTPEIIITLPERVYESITVESNIGSVEISNINCETLYIDSDISEIDVESSSVSEETIIESHIGSIDVDDCIFTGDIEINTEIGDITANLSGDIRDYNIEAHCAVGSKSINGSSKSAIDNDAPNNIELDCEVGSINLEIE